MKILNLYSGIGGNRKLWEGHNITAVEYDEKIAQIYRDHFPEDKVVVTDAHQYLKENYHKFDFIWSSPPCPTHSRIRNEAGVGSGQNKPVYPDMELYEEILFLQRVAHVEGTGFNGSYVVENVKPDYEPLIDPQEIQRHYFWANYTLPSINVKADGINNASVEELEEHHGFDLSGYGLERNKRRKIIRNCTHPEIGKAILDAVEEQKSLFEL